MEEKTKTQEEILKMNNLNTIKKVDIYQKRGKNVN